LVGTDFLDLKVFLNPLKEALKTGKAILKQDAIDAIFSTHFSDLLDMHCTFLLALEKRLTQQSNDELSIGDVFLALVSVADGWSEQQYSDLFSF
jgi:hypothetical protein